MAECGDGSEGLDFGEFEKNWASLVALENEPLRSEPFSSDTGKWGEFVEGGTLAVVFGERRRIAGGEGDGVLQMVVIIEGDGPPVRGSDVECTTSISRSIVRRDVATRGPFRYQVEVFEMGRAEERHVALFVLGALVDWSRIAKCDQL